MTNGTNTLAAPTRNTDTDTATLRTYRPRLSFYHANSKGSGSAAHLEMVPATGERDGAIYMTLAQQKSVASGSTEQGTRQHATFDWQNRITVKLNFTDLCQMLLVFTGQAATISDGKGLYHDNRSATTVINLTHQTEPYAGYALEVSRRSKSEPESTARIRMLFNAVEAFGLGKVLEQSLGVVAFGIPRNPVNAGSAPLQREPHPDEESAPF